MYEKSIFSVVATPASSILIRHSKKKKLCPVTVLVDSQVSDRCPWAACCLDSNLSTSFWALQYTTLAIVHSDWILLHGEKLPVELLTALISRLSITGIPVGL